MRRMEADGSDTGIDRIELEMPELVKSIGAASFGRCLQGKEAKARVSAKAGGGCRIHGIKTKAAKCGRTW